MRKNRRLVRLQLEATLGKFMSLRNSPLPPKGWIRAIRDALGMTGSQLAVRLGVTQQRVALIEKEELSASLTLRTMQSVGEALDCEFVYGFVPKSGLENSVYTQALAIARKRMEQIAQNMELEGRSLREREDEKALADLARKIIVTEPDMLWEEE